MIYKHIINLPLKFKENIINSIISFYLKMAENDLIDYESLSDDNNNHRSSK